jgi:DNA polymerase-3 subunit delta'
MSWQNIEGHDRIVKQFRRALQRGRLASTFLFLGPEGIGKRMFALKLAQAFLCERVDERKLDPCGICPPCQQVMSGTHPDLELVSKPADRSFIPVDVFIGDREHRMRTGMCHRISLTPVSGKRRVAIIDDADYLNQEGANCLLKTLEEPPPRSAIILIGTSEQRQLPTIRSRSQIIRFAGLEADVIGRLLIESGIDPRQAQRAQDIAGGSLERARQFVGSDALEHRERLWRVLATTPCDRRELVRMVTEFTDEAGKEMAAKRIRLREIAETAIEFYRELLRQLVASEIGGGNSVSPEPGCSPANPVREFAGQIRDQWRGNSESIASCIDRCLDALWQIDANANVPTLTEAWLADLAQVHRTRQPLALS